VAQRKAIVGWIDVRVHGLARRRRERREAVSSRRRPQPRPAREPDARVPPGPVVDVTVERSLPVAARRRPTVAARIEAPVSRRRGGSMPRARRPLTGLALPAAFLGACSPAASGAHE
jgi:hypothetical protein